jgi:hypothetical protein
MTTSTGKQHHVPLLLWPFYAIWLLVTGILKITGRLVAVILGFLLMLVGVLVSLTIIGLIIGVPVFIIGLLLVFRGLF